MCHPDSAQHSKPGTQEDFFGVTMFNYTIFLLCFEYRDKISVYDKHPRAGHNIVRIEFSPLVQ